MTPSTVVSNLAEGWLEIWLTIWLTWLTLATVNISIGKRSQLPEVEEKFDAARLLLTNKEYGEWREHDLFVGSMKNKEEDSLS